jgi:hypothetical protein
MGVTTAFLADRLSAYVSSFPMGRWRKALRGVMASDDSKTGIGRTLLFYVQLDTEHTRNTNDLGQKRG